MGVIACLEGAGDNWAVKWSRQSQLRRTREHEVMKHMETLSAPSIPPRFRVLSSHLEYLQVYTQLPIGYLNTVIFPLNFLGPDESLVSVLS